VPAGIQREGIAVHELLNVDVVLRRQRAGRRSGLLSSNDRDARNSQQADANRDHRPESLSIIQHGRSFLRVCQTALGADDS
jgi:hypothetical protein